MQNKRKLKVIGVTGGIGSGKSMVLEILKRDYHAFVIQTDQLAKQLQLPDTPGYQALIDEFGTGILSIDRSIDREQLSRMIFDDPDSLKKVNRIIHPIVWRRVKELIAHSSEELIVVESALFSEKSDDICDELWYVYTSREVRITRLLKSRGYSREKAGSIIKNQPSEEMFIAIADHIIKNDGTIEELEQQIKRLLS